MELSREDVLRMAALSKIGMDEKEAACFQEQLSGDTRGLGILKQVNTEGVPPTVQVNAFRNNMSDDRIQPSLSREEVLTNAPGREGDFFRIRAVLEED